MIHYLPDTNIIIYALAAKHPYADFLRTCIISNTLVISVIVVAEFLSGAQRKEKAAFENLLFHTSSLAINEEAARMGGYYRKMYKKTRLPDALLAASCKVHNITLVTNNLRDFPMKDIKKTDLRNK